MLDIEKQVAFWRAGANEDLAVGRDLMSRKHTRHGLFFVHLAVEKALKAIVCRVTKDVPPRVHNLVRLSELAGISPTQAHLETLATMNAFNVEGRYPETLQPPPTPEMAQNYLRRAEEVFSWLISR
jgi:HEPN domain-containing protein